MRLGKNPLKEIGKSFQCEKVGIAILNFIPFEIGYFKDSFDILKIQIESIKQSVMLPVNIIIFDNGSNISIQKKLIQFLEKKEIDFLFLSNHNLGKTGAMNWLFSAMPNEYIAYTDSDVLFRKGWLEKSIEIFEKVPKTGLVSAQPCLYDVLKGNYKTIPILDDGLELVYDFFPDNVISEYITGLGGVKTPITKFSNKKYTFIVSKDQRVSSVIGASHMQFLTKKEIINSILPLTSNKTLSKEEDFQFNKKIDELNFLQLSTSEPLVYHMGNSIDEIVEKELKNWTKMEHIINNSSNKNNFESNTQIKKIIRFIIKKMNNLEKGRRLIDAIYNIIFDVKLMEK